MEFRQIGEIGDIGEFGEMDYTLKVHVKNRGIRLMLETVREISGKMLVFVSSINRFYLSARKARKNIYCLHNEIGISRSQDS